MVVHAWSEHVVHVRLVSDDREIAAAAARFLQLRFPVEDVEVSVEPGRLRVHSEPTRRVTAALVARALVEAGVRAHALYEREEWLSPRSEDRCRNEKSRRRLCVLDESAEVWR